MQPVSSMYVFNGHKFLEFIDTDEFKNNISKIYDIPKDKQNLDFPNFYEYLLQEFPQKSIEKVFFENILYSHLKNIFVDRISSHPNLNVNSFKDTVRKIIEDINHKDTIPSNFFTKMSENGFYLMDVLNITVHNATFIAGYDYTENNKVISNARFLFVEVVPKKDQTTYFIAGVEIDFQKNISLTMIRNISGIDKVDAETDNTINKLHSKVINKILHKLGIKLEEPSVEDDRAGMYKFCKELDDRLLDDIRTDLLLRTTKSVKDSVKILDKALFNKQEYLNSSDKSDLEQKIQALLLSYYIEYKYKPKDLVRKAKEKKLVGYPTRVKFTSGKSGKSSTQSSNKNLPVSTSDMFHSLYFNFKQALGLESWSISWFSDYTFKDNKNIEVIQTTIYSTSKQFRIVFLPTKPLNKEIIHYVVNTLNSYR